MLCARFKSDWFKREMEVPQCWKQHAWGGLCPGNVSSGSGCLLCWGGIHLSVLLNNPQWYSSTKTLGLMGPSWLAMFFILPAQYSKAKQVHQGQVLLQGHFLSHCQRPERSQLQTAKPEVFLPKQWLQESSVGSRHYSGVIHRDRYQTVLATISLQYILGWKV